MNAIPFNKIAAQIEGSMSTYHIGSDDGTGGIGGLIATYWASSPYVAGPYIMNPYGLIRGLCARANDKNSSMAKERVEKYIQYYLRCQDKTTGLFISTWGEDPFIGYGLVQQASVIAALWDAHRNWPNQEIFYAANQCWHACLNYSGMRLSWMVHNQALRCCEALIMGIRARGDSKPKSDEKALLERIGKQVKEAQWDGNSLISGAISQAIWDDRIIMPYQGKCINPLIEMSNILKDSFYLNIAKKLADFIVVNIQSETGDYLLRGQYIPEGRRLPFARRIYPIWQFFPFLEHYLRHYRQHNIDRWIFNPWPKWIARGLDTARGLYNLGHSLGEEKYCNFAKKMVFDSLRYQTPLGGLRNTLGFFGENPDESGGLVWQDVAPIPRWNSYAVQFIHELAVGTPVLKPQIPEPECQDIVELADNLTFIETIREVRVQTVDQNVLWSIKKGNRWGRPFRAVHKGEGGAAVGRLRNIEK